MAQEKLLYVLNLLKISHWLVYGMLMLAFTNPVLASENQEWARGVLKNAQSSTMEGIKDKYIELQRMLGVIDFKVDIHSLLKQGDS